jgi:hypothetical protein
MLTLLMPVDWLGSRTGPSAPARPFRGDWPATLAPLSARKVSNYLPRRNAALPCRPRRGLQPAKAGLSDWLTGAFAARCSRHTKASPKVVVVALVGDIRASA